MAKLNDLMLADLPRVGSRVLIGSTGPMRRACWPKGERIAVESGRIYSYGLARRGGERRESAWKPYCVDLLADDWEVYAS